MAGILLKNSTPTVNNSNLHGVMPKIGIVNASKGSQAPMYMKHAQLRTRSMTEAKSSPSVCTLKSPSHDIALPVSVRLIGCVDEFEKRLTCGKGG